MTTESAKTPFDLVQEQFAQMAQEREFHVRKIAEIDQRAQQAAKALGLTSSVPEVEASPRTDGRRAGSMTEFVMNTLGNAPKGMTRSELKLLLQRSEKFGDQVRKNENSVYNLVSRGLKRKEIQMHGDRIYLTPLAPSPEEAALSQSVDSQNISLFPAVRENTGG